MNDEGLARQPLVRIVLADDHSVMRSGLRMFPDAEPDFEVVAEASDERSAARYVRGHKPDVLILDLNMPGGSGLDAIPAKSRGTRAQDRRADNATRPSICAPSTIDAGNPHQRCGAQRMTNSTPSHNVTVMLERSSSKSAKEAHSPYELPEPARRYLSHALPAGFHVASAVQLRMTGRIKVGLWLPFRALQDCDGRSFEWRARVGIGPLAPLEVVDRYSDGEASVSGRLGRRELFHQDDSQVRRSAAGRAALEAVFAPGSLTSNGVSWRAESDDHIVASSYIEPEQVEVHMRIAPDGRLLSVVAQRWGEIRKGSYGYSPFGGEMHTERRFGALVIPSKLTVGWNYGARDYAPFFKATIRSLVARSPGPLEDR